MTRAFVIPGCGQSASNYDLLNEALSSSGHTIVPVEIDWQTARFDEWIAQGKKQLTQALKEDLIIGFSYGGNIAMHSRPDLFLNLCSVPNIYSTVPATREFIQRITRAARVDLDWTTVDRLKNPSLELTKGATFFAGDKGVAEPKYLEFARVFTAHPTSPSTKLVHIAGAEHNINSKNYVEGLVHCLFKPLEVPQQRQSSSTEPQRYRFLPK